jgi:hypothetical protein
LPTLAFLEQEVGLTRRELRNRVVKDGRILGAGLGKRLRPRLAACRAAGVDDAYVLSCLNEKDDVFCERAGIDPAFFSFIRER